MSNLTKKVEMAANVAIILVAVLLAAVLTRQYLFPAQNQNQAQRPAPPVPQNGKPVTLADVDWKKNGKTLLLVVSSTCRFCTDSAPFYQRLVKERGSAQVIALVPQPPEEGRAYMQKLGVEVADVRQVSLAELGVGGTPTLILVDGEGKVSGAWVGALQPDKENEVIGRLRAD